MFVKEQLILRLKVSGWNSISSLRTPGCNYTVFLQRLT